MTNKVRWGVLSTAGIAVKKVVPAMQKGEWSDVTAIASRDLHKAEDVARTLGIPKVYGSYEELLADPQVEAVYNPLPNQLHVPWSIKAAEAGKHVLCEKPISMTVAEASWLSPGTLVFCARFRVSSATSISIPVTSATSLNAGAEA
jgi:predicted dehydrogenase